VNTLECVAEDFDGLVRRHERELHVHCYRMLGSFEAAQDLVQETFLRAWRHRDDLTDGTGARAWLYRIATNACLDELRRLDRHPTGRSEVSWIQPYPDRLLDEQAEPDAVAITRETIELAYLTALQVLPARQRAVLLLRDVLGWTAAEAADALELSQAAANSALQRARAGLREALPPRRSDWSTARPSPREKELALRFIDAHERADAAASVALAAADIRITMPPHPFRFDGLDAVRGLIERSFGEDSMGEWRLLLTAANRQPAAACYLRRPGEGAFYAFKLDVLRLAGEQIVEITTFDATLFGALGLPPVVSR
jgi:RNA polymerase sigma-70 factor (ECF subfamily)